MNKGLLNKNWIKMMKYHFSKYISLTQLKLEMEGYKLPSSPSTIPLSHKIHHHIVVFLLATFLL